MNTVRLLRLLLGVLVSLTAASAFAGGRSTNCYRVDEEAYQNTDQSQDLLCVTSSNLAQYPKSVVTVTLLREDSKAPLRSDLPGLKAHMLARRHFVMLAPDSFGRHSQSDKSRVTFNRANGTVFVSFASSNGKTFFYKPVKAGFKDLAQGQ